MTEIKQDKKTLIFYLKDKKNKAILACSKHKKTIYNEIIKCGFLFFKILKIRKRFYILGIMLIKDKHSLINHQNINIQINNKSFKISTIYPFYLKIPFFKYIIKLCYIKIPTHSFTSSPIHNVARFSYCDQNGFGMYKNIKYHYLFPKLFKYSNSAIIISKHLNRSFYFRKSNKNTLILTVRPVNKTDLKTESIKIKIAYYLHKCFPFIKKDLILMYEKNSNRYEESASVLYERLIDIGYKNVYYIIDKSNPVINKIEKKYLKNLLYKRTLKHYLYFFISKTFIATEGVANAIDSRVANRFVLKKIFDSEYMYVFLQHGVMYMLSLSAKSRKFARKTGNKIWRNSKIVVSSDLEANHFVEYGKFDRKDLYITGLPKFDRIKHNSDADKILIMPTWRPWEYNELSNDPLNTGYYNMILDMFKAIPKNMRANTYLLPHPVFLDDMKKTPLNKFIPTNLTYNEVLSNVKLLITDYSSVAYDAFYRKANVIFWWKDKDECMEKYGGELMLNDKNAFGDICYNINELKTSVKQNYKSDQKDIYIENYKKIVQFDDNNNTERVIDFLIKDNILKKR